MKVFQFKIILLGFTLFQGIEVSAKQSTKMITYDGLAKYADRFEFLPSDDCKSFEMRSWGRVLDKENNTLSKNDLISLNLHSGPFDIVNVALVLSISDQIDDRFDVVYISFGNWSWDMEKVFKQLNIQSITAVHLDKKASIEANIWKTPELPEKLRVLRENCLGIIKFGET